MIDIGFWGQKFVLVFFRVLSMIWLLPLFSSKTVSIGFKAGLSLLVAFLLLDSSASGPDLDGNAYLISIAIAKEVLIGLSVGFFVRILFSMVSAAGEIISLQTGLSFARFMDPTLGSQVTVLEQIKNLLAVLIFLGIDGHHVVLKAIAVSLKEIPPGCAVIRATLFQQLIDSTGKIFAAGLKVCAPIVVTLFLVELALGLLSRMIPQVNVFIEGASIKVLIGLTMFAISLNLIVPVIAQLFKGMDMEILRLMRSMA